MIGHERNEFRPCHPAGGHRWRADVRGEADRQDRSLTVEAFDSIDNDNVKATDALYGRRRTKLSPRMLRILAQSSP